MDNITTGSDGLTYSMEISTFNQLSYMAPKHRVSPMGLFMAIGYDARITMWKNPEYILAQLVHSGRLGIIIIASEYTFTQSWYNVISTCIQWQNELTAKSHKASQVLLTESISWQARVAFIGGKTFQMTETLYSVNGVELGTVRILCGLVDLGQRKMTSLPEQIQAKAKWIKRPEEPINATLREPTGPVLTRHDFIEPSNIDSNHHTNFAVYVQIANEAFQMFDQNLYAMDKFVILCKRETVLHDVLNTVVWKSEFPDEYCCNTVCKDKIVMFCVAKFSQQHAKPAKL